MSEVKAVEKKQQQARKQLADDEEFEEFPIQEWQEKEEGDEKELSVWEDNWDDESHDNEFSKQLKEELARNGVKMA